MRKPHEPTIGFNVWPVLLMLEGPSAIVGIALSAIYDDPRIERTAWHCDHPYASRTEFAARLRTEGKPSRRLGIGVKTEAVATAIQAKAIACGIKCVVFRGETTSSKPKVR